MTGERFIPESNDIELELEHYERYKAVLELIDNKVVLDAACGEGYGSAIMSSRAAKVISVDIDAETINRAKEKYGCANNIDFRNASIGDLHAVLDKSIDVVVSFETVEHVDESLQKDFLREIKRVLKPDGILIMSSPNKKEYTDRYNFHNKFHVHEMYIEEFEKYLGEEFKNIVLYRQYLEVGAFIDRSDIDETKISYIKDRERNNPDGKYVIAIASNSPIPDYSMSRVTLYPREEYLKVLDNHNDYVHEKDNELKLLNEELERRAVELDNRMELINSSKLELQELQNELKLANEELERRAVELDNRMNVINSLECQLLNIQNELKLANEELERRAVELDNRMDVINELNKRLSH